MKEYRLEDYNDGLVELMRDMAQDLSDVLMGLKLDTKFGKAEVDVLTPSVSGFGNGFTIKLNSPDWSKELNLGIAMKNGIIKLPEVEEQIVKHCLSELEKVSKEQADIDIIRREETRNAEKLAKELEQQKIKDEKRKASVLRELENLPKNKVSGNSDSFFYALGWILSNMTRISAAMPDYCESWFRSYFGDAPARIVDSNKKGPAGYSSQWALSMSIALKNSSKEHIPLYLKRYTDTNAGQDINNTQFVFTLLTDYGFTIGTAADQNIDEIMKFVPAEYLDEFEEGLES